MPPAPGQTPALPTLPRSSRRSRWSGVVLTWLSSLGLAVVYLGIGAGVDDAVAGRAPGAGVIGTALAGLVVAGVAAWAVPVLGSRAQAADEGALRETAVRHLITLGPAERSRERTGRVVSTATDGVERAAAYRATFVGPMIAAMTVPLLVVALVALVVDARTGLLLAAAIPAVPLLIGGFQSAFRSVSTRYRAQARALAAAFLDALQGLTTLRVLDAGRVRTAVLAEQAEALRRRVMGLLAGNQVIILVADLSFSLGMLALAAWLAMTRLADGAITPGQAVSVVLVSTLLLEPLDRIGQFFYVGMGGIASIKELRGLLAQEPAVPDPAAGDRVVLDRIVGGPAVGFVGDDGVARVPAVLLEGVRFGYPGGSGPVLDGFDLRVDPGEQVALVGRSGAGKSTVVELLQAFVRPQAGRVVVGGLDLAVAPLDAARAQVAVVAQSTYLFTGTLAENLRVASADADDDALWAALRTAHLADDVLRLPDRLDTRVGERGLALSGGQAQRVAIARAVLYPAPVLVLDEPTSQVDLASERAILAALAELGAGRTVLTIAHRLSTVADADRMYLLSDGRATEIDPRRYVASGGR